MSCLDATFTLKPRSPYYYQSPHNFAQLACFGADFWPIGTDFSTLYASDQFQFVMNYAADTNLDYSQWANLRKSRYLQLYLDLGDYGAQKQLALIFGFDVTYSTVDGRVLVYSDGGLLHDQKLVYGDNQFLLELESVDHPLILYFIHAGGSWFFKGLSAYVV